MTDNSKETSTRRGFRPINPPITDPPPRSRSLAAVQVKASHAAPGAVTRDFDLASQSSATEADMAADARKHRATKGQAPKTIKDENGKLRPTGDHPVGFGRPPVATRFTGKPGPGRPKGSVSFDKLMAKHLGQRTKVRINGREKAVSYAELIIMTTVKDAIEGKRRDARKQVFADMARLMAPESREANASVKDLNEADRQTMEEFYENVRAEVISEMGVDPAEFSDDAGGEA